MSTHQGHQKRDSGGDRDPDSGDKYTTGRDQYRDTTGSRKREEREKKGGERRDGR